MSDDKIPGWTLTVITKPAGGIYRAGPADRGYLECLAHARFITSALHDGRLPGIHTITIQRLAAPSWAGMAAGGAYAPYPGLLPGDEFDTPEALTDAVARHFGCEPPAELSDTARAGWVRIAVVMLQQNKRVERLEDGRLRLTRMPERQEFPTASL